MTTLVCLGLGYCAQHYIAEFGSRFDRIIGTSRTPASAAALGARRFGGRAIEMHVSDGKNAKSEISTALAAADALLVSAAPAEGADPVLVAFADVVARAANLRTIAYLSSLGVYANSDGAWIDESTPVDPGRARRGKARIEAEAAWRQLGARLQVAVAILRLGGIYGPGQNNLLRLKRGAAQRIAKPGHVSNRIHVFDIAQTIDAVFAGATDGVFNVVDDEPTSPSEQIAFAAELLGMAVPPEIPFADAAKVLSPMALSFYDGCIRARNTRLKTELGIRLRYPNCRDGLRALFEAGDHLA